jgi:hypothetical protein
MERLNEFEFSILNRLASKYKFLADHIPFLRVKDREITGVGMYVNLIYSVDGKSLQWIDPPDASLTTNEKIEISGLKFGLGYEVDITAGRIKYIEIFTYGEVWDGLVTDFSFKSL